MCSEIALFFSFIKNQIHKNNNNNNVIDQFFYRALFIFFSICSIHIYHMVDSLTEAKDQRYML